jgi:hypothetical protein
MRRQNPWPGGRRGLGGRVMKPAGWPQHMREKPLASGTISYFWAPPTRDVTAGFTIRSEALGPDYAEVGPERSQLWAGDTSWPARYVRGTSGVPSATARNSP